MEFHYLIYLFAFFAGMVDAAVGGGGLIQVPALFNLFPQATPATLLGTNKFASIVGTSFSAQRYLNKITLSWQIFLPAMFSAFLLSYLGASAVSLIPRQTMRPIVLVLMMMVTIYTLHRKDFGLTHAPQNIGRTEQIKAIIIGGGIGFYDGIFGPGTGSFLIFMFIRFFAMDFLHASATAKLVNLATNAAALCYFIPSGNVLFAVALPMALANMLGAVTGTWLALRHGAKWVRILFLILVSLQIIKLSYDVLMGV